MSLDEQYDKIYSFCYFKVKNREIAEDITQETFLKYFATTDYLEKGKKLAFLYTIARNLCTDYFRKTKELLNVDDENVLFEDNIAQIETAFIVSQAVSKLDAYEQEIVLLRYTNELSINELAEYLGISRFAVSRKLISINKELKKYLRKEDFYG